MSTIWAHTLVKNEEKYLWFSVMSVINYVDKVLIWDTGSTDNTVRIIKEIKKIFPKKVSFNQVGDININEFTDIRQKMLDVTDSDWFLIVDGDEIWWEESIKKIVEVVKSLPAGKAGSKGREVESIVIPTFNLVGDIFHYQEEAAGKYQLLGMRGHYNLRAINRKIPGLRAEKPHGTFGWVDSEGTMIQDRNVKNIVYIKSAPILHATYLQRSSLRAFDVDVPKREKKYKHEVGRSFPLDFYYPEILFKPTPNLVSSPWRKMSMGNLLRASAETPFRKLKRRVFKDGKEGY